MSGEREEIRRRLAAFPELAAVFDHLVERCRSDGFGLVLKGSLASGSVDAFSDIDATLVAEGDLDEARRWLEDTLRESGRVLASFPATHLGLDWLWIYFLERGGRLVKVDVGIVDPARFAQMPGGTLLSDPEGRLSAAREAVPRPDGPGGGVDLEGLAHRFAGWTWYTYSKIARGELLEAYDSLGVMRAQALLPTLQSVRGLPVEGFRYLEDRLDPAELRAMLATVPAAIERRELLRALYVLVDLYTSTRASGGRAEGGGPEADLASILEMVERSLREEVPGWRTVERPGGAVFSLELPSPGRAYESALVYRLDRELAASVRAIRELLALAPPGEQLEPHLTVLFLGQTEGRRLADLHRRLAALQGESCRVRLGGLGVFRRRGRVTDLHLTVAEEDGLAALHQRALAISQELEHLPQTPYLGDRYVPHVTLFSGLDVPGLAVAELEERLALRRLVPAGAVELRDLYLMVRPLTAGETGALRREAGTDE